MPKCSKLAGQRAAGGLLTGGLCEVAEARGLGGQQEGLFAGLWLQVAAQELVAEQGPRQQDGRGAQAGSEGGEEVSRGGSRRVQQRRTESRHQLPRPKHV